MKLESASATLKIELLLGGLPEDDAPRWRTLFTAAIRVPLSLVTMGFLSEYPCCQVVVRDAESGQALIEHERRDPYVAANDVELMGNEMTAKSRSAFLDGYGITESRE